MIFTPQCLKLLSEFKTSSDLLPPIELLNYLLDNRTHVSIKLLCKILYSFKKSQYTLTYQEIREAGVSPKKLLKNTEIFSQYKMVSENNTLIDKITMVDKDENDIEIFISTEDLHKILGYKIEKIVLTNFHRVTHDEKQVCIAKNPSQEIVEYRSTHAPTDLGKTPRGKLVDEMDECTSPVVIGDFKSHDELEHLVKEMEVQYQRSKLEDSLILREQLLIDKEKAKEEKLKAKEAKLQHALQASEAKKKLKEEKLKKLQEQREEKEREKIEREKEKHLREERRAAEQRLREEQRQLKEQRRIAEMHKSQEKVTTLESIMAKNTVVKNTVVKNAPVKSTPINADIFETAGTNIVSGNITPENNNNTIIPEKKKLLQPAKKSKRMKQTSPPTQTLKNYNLQIINPTQGVEEEKTVEKKLVVNLEQNLFSSGYLYVYNQKNPSMSTIRTKTKRDITTKRDISKGDTNTNTNIDTNTNTDTNNRLVLVKHFSIYGRQPLSISKSDIPTLSNVIYSHHRIPNVLDYDEETEENNYTDGESLSGSDGESTFINNETDNELFDDKSDADATPVVRNNQKPIFLDEVVKVETYY